MGFMTPIPPRCKCGKEKTTEEYSYRVLTDKREVIFEICPHNIIVVDKLERLNLKRPVQTKDTAAFKAMRHIETVRNFLQVCIIELLERAVDHDQSKLQEPELSVFNEHTPKLRDIVYGSEEYKQCMKEMKPAIEHHNKINRHHPEHHGARIQGMNLLDLIEMLCDWKAATLRYRTGDIYKSLEINAERFSYSMELKQILKNTIDWLELQRVQHQAQES